MGNQVKHLLIILSIFLLTLPSVVNSSQSRVALVIGNGAYKEGPLRNPVNDARLMRNLLRKAGFSVTIVENARKKKLISAIRSFGRSLRNSDAALFYFSGHGNQYKGLNWLIPIGADIQRESDLEFEAVNAERVLAEMEGGSSKRVNIVMFDACRSNRSFRSFRSNNRGLAQPRVQPEGSIVAFSTAPGTIAYDGDGNNSPYVAELSKHMLTPGLKIEDVFKRVRIGVKNRTARKPAPQIPWENSSLMGDFYFMFADQAETATESVSSYNELAGSENEEQYPEGSKYGVVVDTTTKFVWQKKPDGVKRTYEEAVRFCKNLKLGGYSNWRLPRAQDLLKVFPRKNIFSPYKISRSSDSSYWSQKSLTLTNLSERTIYPLIPTIINFNSGKATPPIIFDSKGHKNNLYYYNYTIEVFSGHTAFNFTEEWGYSGWKARRGYFQRALEKQHPDYTRKQLDNFFKYFHLEDKSNPSHKHYVRCLHR